MFCGNFSAINPSIMLDQRASSMSSNSSADKGLIEDRFAPFNEFESELLNGIAICSDSDEREWLTWKLAAFYLETARPEKAVTHLQWMLETTRNDEHKENSQRALRFLLAADGNAAPISHGILNLPRVLWELGNAFLGRGIQQPGVLCLLRLLDVSSDQEQRAGCFLLLGAECEKVDDYGSAAQLYQRGIKCKSKEIGTRYFLNNNLGYCLIASGDYESAEKMCLEAIHILPDRHNAHKNLGLALKGQGKYIKAAMSLMKSAFLNPMDTRALMELEILVDEHGEKLQEIQDLYELIASAKVPADQISRNMSVH